MRTLRGRLRSELVWHLLGFALISVLAVWLYYPYLENPLVFDDTNLFHTDILTTAAIAPWELGIRGLPYFTLGWVQTQIGSMLAHRLVSLALHILVAYQMFRFLEEILIIDNGLASPSDDARLVHVRSISMLVATAFVCHPVAVYGAGYLVQRTIVFATLFALLSLRSLLKALSHDQLVPAIWAAGWASLSILSKQHAVTLPFAALALVPVVGRFSPSTIKVTALFLALCIPAMSLAVLTSLAVVGQVYESLREIGTELHALPTLAGRYDTWLLSASTQAEQYFLYWCQWIFPNPHRMSVDMRIDFLRPWTHFGAWLWIGGLLVIPPLITMLSMRLRKWRLVGFALTLTIVLFAIELAAVRFQEPFVLYRSYLWSIGYCAMFAALLMRLPPRLGILLLTLAIPVLVIQASDRLDTFRSKLALWDDAATKLPKLEIAGSSRILFNRGGERFRVGLFEDAMNDINTAIQLNPGSGSLRVARAVALLRQGHARKALDDLENARLQMPQDAHLLFVLSRTLAALGRTAEADSVLTEAAARGSYPARFELAKRLHSGGDVKAEMSERP